MYVNPDWGQLCTMVAGMLVSWIGRSDRVMQGKSHSTTTVRNIERVKGKI